MQQISGQIHISITAQGLESPINIYTSDAKQNLAQALWLSGKLKTLPLCSGLGRCGLCRVRFITLAPICAPNEERILGTEASALGWRLACRHTVQDVCDAAGLIKLEIPPHALPTAEQKQNISITTQAHHTKTLLAIDLGTTSLCWQSLSLEGEILSSGKKLNPLMGAGADIISRLRFAMHKDGARQLASILQEDIKELVRSLSPAQETQEICLAANTAMTCLFLQKDITSLAHAPYALPLQGHSLEHIEGLPPIYVPPQMAPFVGGDISAGYAALLQREDISFPFIFADLGTNGEFILALSKEEAFITSVPMGPSLEGIGLRFGHMVDGSAGIVRAVRLGPTGLQAQTVDDTPPQKICGTGYISIIHALLKVGIIKPDGTFIQKGQRSSPLQGKIAKQFHTLHGERVLQLWPGHNGETISISAIDIEEILKVKAAFSLAMQCLLEKASLAPAALQHIYIAGAMGSHIDTHDLEALGFVPSGATSRIKIIGNSALDGASLLLTQQHLREELQNFSTQCALVNLTQDTHFTEKFMQQMSFSYVG